MPLVEKLANVASEVARAKHWEDHGEVEFRKRALERAIALVDWTITSESEPHRRHELLRLREVLQDVLTGKYFFATTLEQIYRYLLPFAFLARSKA